MHSLESTYLDRLVFNEEQLKTIRAIGDARGREALWYQRVPETLKSLQESAKIESAESSNRLEGVTVAADRLEPLVRGQLDPRTRSEQEIAGYRDALDLIHQSGPDMAFTVNVAKQIHAMLYRYMADRGGEWKGASNDIIERMPDGTSRVRFSPTPPHLVEPQMQRLAENFRIALHQGREPLLLVPLAVLDFLCIHPFRDGNGRTARLITLMLLYGFEYQVGRYISLERVIEQSKETYYETLETSSRGWHQGEHDVAPWLNYFWGVILRAYSEFGEKMQAARPVGYGSKTEQVRLAALNQQEPFTLSALEDACPGVSREMIQHVLRQLREEGALVISGRGRGARWQAVKPANNEQ